MAFCSALIGSFLLHFYTFSLTESVRRGNVSTVSAQSRSPHDCCCLMRHEVFREHRDFLTVDYNSRFKQFAGSLIKLWNCGTTKHSWRCIYLFIFICGFSCFNMCRTNVFIFHICQFQRYLNKLFKN